MKANFSVHHLQMAFQTERRRRLERPDGYGRNKGQCGDVVEIFLVVRDESIKGVFFETEGCRNTIACSNTVAALARNKTVEEAWRISAEDVITFLETLDPAHHHCAELAVGALYRALTDWRRNEGRPWRKLYGTHRRGPLH